MKAPLESSKGAKILPIARGSDHIFAKLKKGDRIDKRLQR